MDRLREWYLWNFVDRRSPSRRGIRLGKLLVKDFMKTTERLSGFLSGFAIGLSEKTSKK